MAIMGRPKLDDPLTLHFNIRMNKECLDKLEYIAKEMNTPKREAIRRLINNEYEKLRKNNG